LPTIPKCRFVGHAEVILRPPARARSCLGELRQPFPMALGGFVLTIASAVQGNPEYLGLTFIFVGLLAVQATLAASPVEFGNQLTHEATHLTAGSLEVRVSLCYKQWRMRLLGGRKFCKETRSRR